MICKIKKAALILGMVFSFGASLASGSEVIANPQNDQPIDGETLKLMLTGKERFWKSGSEVVIAILRTDPEVDQSLSKYSGMTSSKFRNHWQRMVYSGRGKMPKMFNRIDDLVDFVKANEGAIGIVSERSEVEDVRRIPLGYKHDERDEDLVAQLGR